MGYSDLKTKKAKIQHIREKLASDKRWAIRGLMVIFSNQTESEQANDTVINDNGVGFTVQDAEFLTSLSKQYKSRGFLSEKQINILFKKMPKYARQLEMMSLVKRQEVLNSIKAKFGE